MGFLKYGTLIIITFLIACALVVTFTQPPFFAEVPARLFFWKTREFPLYAYVAGAFCAGLCIGLFVALSVYFSYSSKVRAKKRELKDLQARLLPTDAIHSGQHKDSPSPPEASA